ncbi:MAG TPA: hypothetical protein ENO02_07420 [Epsilonproteobacteria bacterium]|nr:hypothetical protein [Campylobacterota bacterium]
MSKKINTPVPYENITEMASKYIIKYVDKKFSTMYWLSGGRKGHGSMDYDEMPKIILHIMRDQLFTVIPFIIEDENTLIIYEMMKKRLNEQPIKLNKEYIKIHQIDIEEIRKDVLLTLFHIFKPTSNREVL